MSAAENLKQLHRRMDCRIKSGNDERKKRKKEREAERRQTQCFMSRTQAAHGSRHGESGLRRPSACGRARLSAFHHGSCGSDRTPPLSSSYALPGTERGRNGRYPLPAVHSAAGCPADRSSCRPGVSTRSRPGAELTAPPAGTASPLPAGVTRRRPFGRDLIRRDVTETVTYVNGNVTGLSVVMPAPVAGIHVFRSAGKQSRGWPEQVQP